MSLIHIVMFAFKPAASEEDIRKVCSNMLALGTKCLHPTSQGPYIKSLTGGINNSPEPHSNGLTHAFVVEFGSAADRDYYVNDDSVHHTFQKEAGQFVEKVCVLDYTVGVFE